MTPWILAGIAGAAAVAGKQPAFAGQAAPAPRNYDKGSEDTEWRIVPRTPNSVNTPAMADALYKALKPMRREHWQRLWEEPGDKPTYHLFEIADDALGLNHAFDAETLRALKAPALTSRLRAIKAAQVLAKLPGMPALAVREATGTLRQRSFRRGTQVWPAAPAGSFSIRKGAVQVSTGPQIVKVSGKTYHIKDKLKRLGFRFDWGTKTWGMNKARYNSHIEEALKAL